MRARASPNQEIKVMIDREGFEFEVGDTTLDLDWLTEKLSKGIFSLRTVSASVHGPALDFLSLRLFGFRRFAPVCHRPPLSLMIELQRTPHDASINM